MGRPIIFNYKKLTYKDSIPCEERLPSFKRERENLIVKHTMTHSVVYTTTYLHKCIFIDKRYETPKDHDIVNL